MRKLSYITILVVLGIAGCRSPQTTNAYVNDLGTHQLTVEFRTTAPGLFGTQDSPAKAHLIGDTITARIPLQPDSLQQDGFHTVFRHEFLVFRREKRRLISLEPPDAPSQVFVLTIPEDPIAAPWTDWLKPDFVDTSSMSWWNLTYDRSRATRSNVIPKEHVEIRYMLEPWESPKER
jgi:hypothetical protein